MKIQKMLLAVFLMSFVSCSDYKKFDGRVKVKGVVLDDKGRSPIPYAKVTVLCWRKVNFDEETYEKIDTVATNNGEFEVYFEEGYKIDIGSVADNYHPFAMKLLDLAKANNIELKLKANNSLGFIKDLGQLPVFIRKYNTDPPKATQYYGIDILRGMGSSFIDSIDIGVEGTKELEYPKSLITSGQGGIVPIFDSTQEEINIAPTEGYVSKYHLRGTEKGFFIRCRDGKTYARLKIFSLEYDRSSPYKSGFYKDLGIMFNVELQTAGREFNTPKSIRLDHYILENL